MPKKQSPSDLAETLAGQHLYFLAFLRKRVESDEEAEEILQAAYAKGLRKLAGVDESANIVAWFFRLLRNSLVDHWRHRAVETAAMARYAREGQDMSERAEAQLEKAVCRCVKKLAETVRPEYAEIIRKVDVDGMSLADYARQSGVSSNNAAVRIHRARRNLKKRLLETCGTCAEHACVNCTCDH
jgi:RNA polymerase sigma-70 factor, ECF subfamily